MSVSYKLVAALAVTLTAAAAHAEGIVENTLWNTSERTLNTYAEFGLGLTGSTESETPQNTEFLGISPAYTLRAGHYILPWLAAEIGGSYTAANQQALLSENRSDFSRMLLTGGARFALPMAITPVAALHLGYATSTSSWSQTGCGLGCNGPEGVYLGQKELSGAVAEGELGLQFAWSHVTAAVVFRQARFLAVSEETSDAPVGVAPDADRELPKAAGAGDIAEGSVGLTFGARF